LAQLWVAHLTSKNVVSQFWDLVFNYIFFHQLANSLFIYFVVQNEIFLVSLKLEICKTCKAIFVFFLWRELSNRSQPFFKTSPHLTFILQFLPDTTFPVEKLKWK
jgi:hypothetical protein